MEAVAGLGEDGLLAVEVLVVAGLVEGVRTGLAVDGVRGVGLGGLIGTVGGTLGIGGAVTDDAEDGELGRLTGGGVGDGGDDGGTSGGDAGKGVTAAGLLLFPAWHDMEIERADGKREKLDHKFGCLHKVTRMCACAVESDGGGARGRMMPAFSNPKVANHIIHLHSMLSFSSASRHLMSANADILHR